MTDQSTADEILEKINDKIAKFRTDIEEGRTADLQGFEGEIKDFCEVLAKLPEEEKNKYQESLISISQELQNLSEVLAEKRDSLKDKIGGLEQQQKAQTAYKKADNIDE